MLTSLTTWIDQRVIQPISAIPAAATVDRLRMNALLIIAGLKLFNFFGGAWDIQWHVAIGRDSLFIPPHLMVMIAFVCGLGVALGFILYESNLEWRGARLAQAARIGPVRVHPAFLGVAGGYILALASAVFDEWWHRTFGIDATLWSPPHLSIMVSTGVVDFSLLLGVAAVGRRLGETFRPGTRLFFGLCLAGAFAFEAVNFQMAEGFIAGYRLGGQGLEALLFPILVGALFPLGLMVAIRLSRKFYIAIAIFLIAAALQYLATLVAGAGFAILQPVSVVEQFVRDNPDSTLAKTRAFAQATGFTGLVGFQQAWMMWLSAPALALISLLDLVKWARRRQWLAVPIFSAGIVITSALWFETIPLLRDYSYGPEHVLLAAGLATLGGAIAGWVGWRLAGLVKPEQAEQ